MYDMSQAALERELAELEARLAVVRPARRRRAAADEPRATPESLEAARLVAQIAELRERLKVVEGEG
jgi:hypothetical protein